MKIQIGVCGHALPIRLASGWIPWDRGMSDFLICLSFVFSLSPRGHNLLQSCEGDGLWPICWHVMAWDAHWKQIWLLYLPDVIKLLSMHKRNFPARFTVSHMLLRKYHEY